MTFARPYTRKVHIERFHTPVSVCGVATPVGHIYSRPSPEDHPHIVYSSQRIEKTPGYFRTYKHGYCFDCHKELVFRGGITGKKDGRTEVSSHVCVTRKKREVHAKTDTKVRSAPSGKISVSGMISIRMRRAYGSVADALVFDKDSDINVEASLMALAARLHSASTSGPGANWESICDDLATDPRAAMLNGRLERVRADYAKETETAAEDGDDPPEPIDYRDELLSMLNAGTKMERVVLQRDHTISTLSIKVASAEEEIERLQRLLAAETARAESLYQKNKELHATIRTLSEAATPA